MRNIYGYVRVSTKEQNEYRQVIAMMELSIPMKNIYIDKQSGSTFERPQYKNLIKKLKEGDLLYIKSIDRLGRNYNDILDQWRIITKEKKADIVVIDMPLLDTRPKDQNLIGLLISDLVLQILSYVAETERTFIKQRQAEGIAVAKEKGVVFGRPEKELPANFQEVYLIWKSGEITGIEAARRCNMPASTYRYKVKQYEKNTIAWK